jgi:hypothetical protein
MALHAAVCKENTGEVSIPWIKHPGDLTTVHDGQTAQHRSDDEFRCRVTAPSASGSRTHTPDQSSLHRALPPRLARRPDEDGEWRRGTRRRRGFWENKLARDSSWGENGSRGFLFNSRSPGMGVEGGLVHAPLRAAAIPRGSVALGKNSWQVGSTHKSHGRTSLHATNGWPVGPSRQCHVARPSADQMGRAGYFHKRAELGWAGPVRSLSLFLLFSVLFHFVFNFQIWILNPFKILTFGQNLHIKIPL